MNSVPRIFKRSDLLRIPIDESGEKLVAVQERLSIICTYEKLDMLPFLGDVMMVRGSVIDMLSSAQSDLRNDTYLQKAFPGRSFNLMLVYGYRHPMIQRTYFENRCVDFQVRFPNLSKEEQMELAHICSADPEVAGHPTGGAVDVTIVADGEQIDMGCRIADFSDVELMEPFSSKVTPPQMQNRMVLRRIMMANGFAPFDGEYWHFSYGDREWAAWYEMPEALYDSVSFEDATAMLETA